MSAAGEEARSIGVFLLNRGLGVFSRRHRRKSHLRTIVCLLETVYPNAHVLIMKSNDKYLKGLKVNKSIDQTMFEVVRKVIHDQNL